jgi:hypothetical protein
MIEIGYSGKVAKSFLRFQGSRPGLFYDLSVRETCPLHCSPAPSEREPGLPPQISREKTAASHQSHSEKTSPPFFSAISSLLFRPQILMRSLIIIPDGFVKRGIFPEVSQSLKVVINRNIRVDIGIHQGEFLFPRMELVHPASVR